MFYNLYVTWSTPCECICRWIPESARWLLANGRVEEAQFYLDKCANFNKKTKPSTNFKLEVSDMTA